MKHWTLTQTACILAILIILWVGCEKSKRQEQPTTTFNVANFRPLDYAVRDTDYYDNSPYIPYTTGLCFGDEMGICSLDSYGYESKCWVSIAMYPILEHYEIQPGY